MFKKSFIAFILVAIFIHMAVLSAAQHIVPVQNGFIYTDSLYSKIYFTDGQKTEVLLSSPGVGRFFSYYDQDEIIGFKYREYSGGQEAPALYHFSTGEIELLHEPVNCSGQVYFSKNGKVSYTIENILFIKDNSGSIRQYDLGSYANIAPISPDGNYAVFNDDLDQLWIIDLENKKKEKITNSEYGNVFPQWSPDSRYLSYNSLDGQLKIYDRNFKKTIDLGQGADLSWSPSTDEFSYLKVDINENGSDFRTDVIVSDIDLQVISRTKTDNMKETNPFYLNDDQVAYYTNNRELKQLDRNSLKKENSLKIEFPISPVIHSTETPSGDTWLTVPYIHQVYDTPGQRGYSSCAPTTAAMVLAYYKLIPKWPFVSGFGNKNNYGAYVHERYYYNDYYFNLTYTDCNSSESYCYTCYGGMGYMWTGGSPNSRMAGYYNKHGVSTQQTWNTNWSTVAAEIDKQQPYSICNFLSSSGHLIVGLGRASNGQRTVIVNDPYGDRNESSWPNRNGAVVRYDWPGYNHGHASLNYANSGYTTMPWCIATNYSAPVPVDSIVDDKQFDHGFYIKAEGNTVPMRYYRSKKTGFGGHHWWTYTEVDAQDICYVTWTPQVENGYYELKAYIPANANAGTALYRVYHAGGVKKVLIDQSSYSDSLVSLGKYLMANDGSNYVYLGDSTGVSGDIIAFDAMIWNTAEFDAIDIASDHTTGYPGYDINLWVQSNLPEGEYEYIWDFGDGTSARGDSVSHAYADTGTYSIGLTVRANGVENSIYRSNMITVHENTFSGNELTLVYPDSMEIIATRTPVLTWSSEASFHTLFFNDIPEFDSTDVIDSIATNWTRLSGELSEDKTYYWKVTDDSGNSSRVWCFKVNSLNSRPDAFELVSPDNNFIADTLRPSFEWSASRDRDPGDDALKYNLYIGNSIDSMLCVYSGHETQHDLTFDLNENGQYNWYVEACDKMNSTIRSSGSSRVLFINTENEAPPAPVLVTPNNNSYQTTRYPYFEWTEVQDPDPGDHVTYEISYWTSSSTSIRVVFRNNNYMDNMRVGDMREYFWKVAAVDDQDLKTYSDTMVFYTNTTLDVVEIPESYSLKNNFPNPFNPVTSISYELPEDVYVRLKIYDLTGKMIRDLVNDLHSAGKYTVQFDASRIPSGIYVYKIEADSFTDSKKMLLLK